jgi:alcohol dehydrogenase
MTRITAATLRTEGAQRPYADSLPLDLAELELAPPRPGELLLRIDAAGLCHSDLSVINGDRPRPLPMALGHEATGIVEALGDPDDITFSVGDRVVLAFLPSCGECARCVGGERWLCEPGTLANGKGEMLRGGVRLDDHGHDVKHHLGVSGFATHAVVDRRSAVKIDSDVPSEVAALFGCAVLTGMGAVVNDAKVRPGENVVIYGLGGVGLAALLGAVAAGAEPITVVDPVPEKRALALELGARFAFAPGDTASLTGTADAVIETVGKAVVLAAAYKAGRRGSRIVTVGLPNPAEMLAIPAVSLVAEAKTLIGSYMGSSVPQRDIPRFIALWKAGRLPVERLLSSVSPLAEINGLLDKLADGSAIRQIVRP